MRHKFENDIDRLIHSEELLADGGRVIVGLSGGADSVALLSALTELGYNCVAAHCNFALRGEEAERDQKHAQNIALSLGAEWKCIKFDTKAYMQQHGVSAEMACRDLRYEWFNQIMKDTGAEAIAVAHHRDDNVETMLLNLLRGAGVHGLRGMKPKNGNVIRPMLKCSRTEVMAYLADKGLTYVTDSSNNVNDVKRNKLRNIILPLLNEEFQGATEAIVRSINALHQNELIVTEATKAAATQYIKDGILNIKALVSEHKITANALLYEILYPMGFTAAQINGIMSAYFENSSGRLFRTPYQTALLDRGRLIMNVTEVSNLDEYDIDIKKDVAYPILLKIELIQKKDFKPQRNKNIIYLDAQPMHNPHQWKLRHWHEGDRMIPFGMIGGRKLSDIFSDAKLSLQEKKNVWLLTCDGKIVWIVGMRASNLYKITDNTTDIIKITYIPKPNENNRTED